MQDCPEPSCTSVGMNQADTSHTSLCKLSANIPGFTITLALSSAINKKEIKPNSAFSNLSLPISAH